jgi:hypothetical protein
MQKAYNYNWDTSYWNHIERNIGHVTYEEQELLRTSPIGIFGVGGLGGLVAEQLVRSGCERLVILDNDKFDESNLNRQICTREHLNQYKVDVLQNRLQDINPNVRIKKFYKVSINNVGNLLEEIKIVALTLDDPFGSIIIARKCREKNIPIVESWGIPYLWAWWFTRDSIDFETCYNLDTQSIPSDHLNEIELTNYGSLFSRLCQFPGIEFMYDRQKGMFENMKNGEVSFRSFAPFIGICASNLTKEIIFVGLLQIKSMVFAPRVKGYDYIRDKIIDFVIKLDE